MEGVYLKMTTVLIISIIIIFVVIILSAVTTSKAYKFKHTVDPIPEKGEKNEHKDKS